MSFLTFSGASQAGPDSGIRRWKLVPGSMSSKEERASGCRSNDLGVKTTNWMGQSKIRSERIYLINNTFSNGNISKFVLRNISQICL